MVSSVFIIVDYHPCYDLSTWNNRGIFENKQNALLKALEYAFESTEISHYDPSSRYKLDKEYNYIYDNWYRFSGTNKVWIEEWDVDITKSEKKGQTYICLDEAIKNWIEKMGTSPEQVQKVLKEWSNDVNKPLLELTPYDLLSPDEKKTKWLSFQSNPNGCDYETDWIKRFSRSQFINIYLRKEYDDANKTLLIDFLPLDTHHEIGQIDQNNQNDQNDQNVQIVPGFTIHYDKQEKGSIRKIYLEDLFLNASKMNISDNKNIFWKFKKSPNSVDGILTIYLDREKSFGTFYTEEEHSTSDERISYKTRRKMYMTSNQNNNQNPDKFVFYIEIIYPRYFENL